MFSGDLTALFVIKDSSETCIRCNVARSESSFETEFTWICDGCGHENCKQDELISQEPAFNVDGGASAVLTTADRIKLRISKKLEEAIEKFANRMQIALPAQRVLPLMKNFFNRYHWPTSPRRVHLYICLFCYLQLVLDQDVPPRLDEFVLASQVPRVVFIRWLYKICDTCQLSHLPEIDFRRLAEETVRRLVLYIEADERGEDALALLPNKERYRPAYRNKRKPKELTCDVEKPLKALPARKKKRRLQLTEVENSKGDSFDGIFDFAGPDSIDLYDPSAQQVSSAPALKEESHSDDNPSESECETGSAGDVAPSEATTDTSPASTRDTPVSKDTLGQDRVASQTGCDEDKSHGGGISVGEANGAVNDVSGELSSLTPSSGKNDVASMQTPQSGGSDSPGDKEAISDSAVTLADAEIAAIGAAAAYDDTLFDIAVPDDCFASFNEDVGIFDEVSQQNVPLLFDDLFGAEKRGECHTTGKQEEQEERASNRTTLNQNPQLDPLLLNKWVDNICTLGRLCEISRLTTAVPVKSRFRKPDPIYTLTSFVYIGGRMAQIPVRQKDICSFFRVVKPNVSLVNGLWLDTLIWAAIKRGLTNEELLCKNTTALFREKRDIKGRIYNILQSLFAHARKDT